MKSLKKMLTISICFHSFLLAEISHGVLEKHKKNDIFVCMGIYSCVNLARALNAGFRELHGIDEDKVLVDHAKVIFPQDINNNPFNITNYNMHHGGLQKFIKIIFKICTPMTILLGSHYPDVDCPKTNEILQELDAIKNHPIKTHTILVDHINFANTDSWKNISLKDIKKKILEINPRYTFYLEKGGRLEDEENAILVASITE